MIFEVSDIQQHIFHFENNNAKAGMLLNDLLYDNRNKTDNTLDFPKKHERFSELSVPAGLVVGGYNNKMQSGGSVIDFAKQTDIDVITNEMFDKLLDQVSLNRNSSNGTRKRNSTRHNSTKKK
jgi:hypothetical protein|tara:strand:- start:157 stop:525 length:369 start_codon:yes stop_codon:yes gene_type:complete